MVDQAPLAKSNTLSPSPVRADSILLRWPGITSTNDFWAIPFHCIASLLYLDVSTEPKCVFCCFTPKNLAIWPKNVSLLFLSEPQLNNLVKPVDIKPLIELSILAITLLRELSIIISIPALAKKWIGFCTTCPIAIGNNLTKENTCPRGLPFPLEPNKLIYALRSNPPSLNIFSNFVASILSCCTVLCIVAA